MPDAGAAGPHPDTPGRSRGPLREGRASRDAAGDAATRRSSGRSASRAAGRRRHGTRSGAPAVRPRCVVRTRPRPAARPPLPGLGAPPEPVRAARLGRPGGNRVRPRGVTHGSGVTRWNRCPISCQGGLERIVPRWAGEAVGGGGGPGGRSRSWPRRSRWARSSRCSAWWRSAGPRSARWRRPAPRASSPRCGWSGPSRYLAALGPDPHPVHRRRRRRRPCRERPGGRAGRAEPAHHGLRCGNPEPRPGDTTSPRWTSGCG